MPVDKIIIDETKVIYIFIRRQIAQNKKNKIQKIKKTTIT